MNLKRKEVGKIFQEGKTRYYEGVKFDFDQSGPILYLFWEKPASNEVQNIKSGTFQAGLKMINDIIFFLCRFGTELWMDIPYSVHLSRNVHLDKIESGTGYGLTIFLIDASTGILKAGRLIGLDTEFSKHLNEMIIKQNDMDFDSKKYDSNIFAAHNRFSTDDLVKNADFIAL